MIRTTRSIWALPLILSSIILALAGCSSAPKPIAVTMTEFAFQMSSTTAKAGDVTFKITNSGQVVHELVVEQTDLTADKLPKNAEGVVDEEKLTSMGEQGDIEPGKTVDLTLNLHPGTYMIICNLPGHFTGGMHTEFTVTP